MTLGKSTFQDYERDEMSLHDDFEESKWMAGEMQQEHLDTAQAYGQAKLYLENIQPFWEQLAKNPNNQEGASPILESGMANVAAVKGLLLEAYSAHRPDVRMAQSVAISTGFLTDGTAAISLFDFETPTEEWARIELPSAPAPDINEGKALAAKLCTIDPALGRVCAEILESLYGTVADPERAALLMARQAWDHLFDKLAPNDLVRKSQFWTKTSEETPELVTRMQRINYAVGAHVKNPKRRAAIAAASRQMLLIYEELNGAHKRGKLDRAKALSTVRAGFGWLKEWADALEL